MADSLIAASRHQVCCDLNGEAVILNLKNGKYYGVDEVGARVWALIQEPKSAAEIRDVLLSEFEVDPGVCELDLIDLVKGLLDAGLVEVRSGDVGL